MKDKLFVPEEIISSKIYFVRETKVMFDYDLAELYAVETKQLKRAVRRSINRFPSDFMFELTENEFNNLRCQFGTSSWGGSRYLPMAFSEQGIAMLSGVLNSERAIQVNIQIMRIFTKVRQMLVDNLSLRIEVEEIKKKIANQDKNIELVFSYLDELIEKKENETHRRKIGFNANND